MTFSSGKCIHNKHLYLECIYSKTFLFRKMYTQQNICIGNALYILYRKTFLFKKIYLAKHLYWECTLVQYILYRKTFLSGKIYILYSKTFILGINRCVIRRGIWGWGTFLEIEFKIEFGHKIGSRPPHSVLGLFNFITLGRLCCCRGSFIHRLVLVPSYFDL